MFQTFNNTLFALEMLQAFMKKDLMTVVERNKGFPIRGLRMFSAEMD